MLISIIKIGSYQYQCDINYQNILLSISISILPFFLINISLSMHWAALFHIWWRAFEQMTEKGWFFFQNVAYEGLLEALAPKSQALCFQGRGSQDEKVVLGRRQSQTGGHGQTCSTKHGGKPESGESGKPIPIRLGKLSLKNTCTNLLLRWLFSFDFLKNTVLIGYSDWPPSRGLRSL